MGFGFKIAPGVRVYPGSRGLGVGMRAGPVSYYTRTGRSRGSGGSVAAYQRQLRAAQRQQEIETVIALDRELARLGSLHEQDYPPTQPPDPAVAGPVVEHDVRKRLEKAELKGVPLLRFSERRAAKEKARGQLETALELERRHADEERAARQRELDEAWNRLASNDPGTVLATIEEAFADNEAPAVAVNCSGDRVDLVMRWPELDDVVAERKFATTPSGNPTHRKRGKAERHALYLETMASNALATVKEAFAVAPALNRAGLLVFRDAHAPAFGDRILEPLFAGVVTRDMLASINWSGINPAATLVAVPEARIGLRGKSKELRPIDISDDPEAVAVVDHLAVGLGFRSPYGMSEPATLADDEAAPH